MRICRPLTALVLGFIASVALTAESRSLAELTPVPPATEEKFRATKDWLRTEPLAWKAASDAGLDVESRRIFMLLIFDESRGKVVKSSIGLGCLHGMGQIMMGGTTDRLRPKYTRKPGYHYVKEGNWFYLRQNTPLGMLAWVKAGPQEDGHVFACPSDGRKIISAVPHPKYGNLRTLPTSRFDEIELGLLGAAYIFRARVDSLKQDPFWAVTSYKGCSRKESSCGDAILGRLKHWWATGLGERVFAREQAEQLPSTLLME